MTNEQRLLLALLKENLTGKPGTIPEELLQAVDWSAVMTEARQQTVTLQAFDAVGTYRTWIPKEVYSQWFLLATRVMQNNLRVQQGQKELVETLNAHGDSCVILKGTSAASYYPRPDLRTLGDVDFLIDPDRKREICQYLAAEGYETDGKEYVYDIVLHRAKIVYEMHYRVAGIPDGQIGETISAYFKSIVERREQMQYDGMAFFAPSQGQHGMVILLHMLHHLMSGGFGLRHLCDWAAFVQKTGELPFWEQELLPLLREIGLLRFTSVMTKLSARYLGSYCPAWAVAEDAVVELVLEDILTGGNFGRKEETRAKAGSMISDHGKSGVSHGVVWNLYHTLHRSTEAMYPRLKGHPVLLFFVDTARAIRYVFLTLIGKRPSHWKMYPYAMERRDVYRQLSVFETE